MKKSEIQVGGHYTAKVSGRLTTVRVDAIRDYYSQFAGKTQTVYDVTNIRTGRKTTFRSAAKFRQPASLTNHNEQVLIRLSSACHNGNEHVVAQYLDAYDPNTPEGRGIDATTDRTRAFRMRRFQAERMLPIVQRVYPEAAIKASGKLNRDMTASEREQEADMEQKMLHGTD